MATGILLSGGKIFIQQRNNDDIWGGLWEFPGGRVEEGEKPAETVVREYREETGFEVKVYEEVTSVIHFYTRYKVVLHCYSVALVDEELQPRPNLTAAQEYKWVPEEVLKLYAFPAGHRKILDYVYDYCPELLG